MGTRCPAWVQKLPFQVHPSLEVPVAHWVTEYGVHVGTATGTNRIQGWLRAGLVGADGPCTATQVPPNDTPPEVPEQPTVGPGPRLLASTGEVGTPIRAPSMPRPQVSQIRDRTSGTASELATKRATVVRKTAMSW